MLLNIIIVCVVIFLKVQKTSIVLLAKNEWVTIPNNVYEIIFNNALHVEKSAIQIT